MKVLLAVSLLVVLALADDQWKNNSGRRGLNKGSAWRAGRRGLGPVWDEWKNRGSGRRGLGPVWDKYVTTGGRREMGPIGGFGGGFSNLACALARKNIALGISTVTTDKCMKYFCDIGEDPVKYCKDDKGAPIVPPTTDSEDGEEYADPNKDFSEMTDAEKEAKKKETGMTDEEFALIKDAQDEEENNSSDDEEENDGRRELGNPFNQPLNFDTGTAHWPGAATSSRGNPFNQPLNFDTGTAHWPGAATSSTGRRELGNFGKGNPGYDGLLCGQDCLNCQNHNGHWNPVQRLCERHIRRE